MPDFSVPSLRGGMNNTDPAIAIPDDQATLMQNVELVESMLGERRLGTSAITLPAFLSARDRVTFLHRHLPTADETEAQLWALGVTGTSAAHLGYKDTAWSEVTISDTPTLTGFGQYRWQAVTLHGKLHFFYPSDQDRAHVFDGTSMRRSGLAEPSAPTAADTAGAGTFSGTRYGRIRVVELNGSTVLRRSEPSDALTFSPVGNKDGITWTRPTLPGEGETHWEIELSVDNATFYMMSRIAVATSTYTDNEAYASGYASGTLSEDVGDYSLLWSARYATADEDRLIIAGSWADDALASRVGWTPVFNAEGVGNDERLEDDTDPTLDLDTYKHGPITGLSEPVLGSIWITKLRAVYKMTRTGSGTRTKAYDFDKYTDAVGGIHGSLMSGVDETGQPCLYALDLEQGPYRIGLGGLKRSGEDLRATWQTLNINANAVVTSCCFYPKKKQAIWNIATGDSNTPDTAIVLHVDKSRTFADGVRKGWVLWTGTRTEALAMCLFATNIEDDTARNLNLVPFIALEGNGLIHQCDIGTDDNGDAFTATITTKPYVMGSILHHFEVQEAAVMGKAVAGAAVDVTCIRDMANETTSTVDGVSFTPDASETSVIRKLDNLKGAEMHVGQIGFTDAVASSAQWQLQRFDMLGSAGQS